VDRKPCATHCVRRAPELECKGWFTPGIHMPGFLLLTAYEDLYL